jgi:hypothetical protein
MHNVPDYYLLLEKVGWRLTDFDFDTLDRDQLDDDDRQKILETALIENGIPHYVNLWTAIPAFAGEWELRQFALIWSFEELRHAEALRLLGEKAGVPLGGGLDTVRDTAFVENRNGSCPTGCYATIPGMLMYTVLQELVTWKFYSSWARSTRSEFVRALLGKIAADEMRHHQWFANAIARYFERAPDRAEYRRRILEAMRSFHMPHVFYPGLHFPFIDNRLHEYFTVDDFNQMKQKVVKVLSFDQELFMMLVDAAANGLSPSFGGARPAGAGGAA